MPPKQQQQGQQGQTQGQTSSSKKPSKKSSQQQATEGAEEEPLVAVILADSFDRRFTPLTLSRPRCLLPFCGVPLINLSLERLLQASVSKVHVLANSHAALVRGHIDSLRKAGALTGMDVIVHGVPDARSVGDAMRELDTKELIRGDFILLQPDCVGNVDIKEQVRVHTERRKADKDVIMTLGTMQVSPTARNSPKAGRAVMAVRPDTNQLLHYDCDVLNATKTSLPFEELFSDADSDVEVRLDLRETGVDICSLDVPPLFSENFDYQTLRRDFVIGILTSDLLESKLHLHIGSGSSENDAAGASTSYGARCDSSRAYDGIALDVLTRASWPIAPGCPSWPGERLESRQGARYIGTSGVNIDRSAVVGDKVLASSGVSIGPNSYVAASTLAAGTKIASNSAVISSHLFENVSIGRDCRISSSIIGRNVKILTDVTIERGCLIADGCTIGPSTVVPEGSRVALQPLHLVDFDVDTDEAAMKAQQKESAGADARLGPASVGYVWPSILRPDIVRGDVGDSSDDDSDKDEEEDDDDEPAELLCRLLIGYKEADFLTAAEQAEVRAAAGGAPDEDEDEDEDDGMSSIEGDSEFEEDDAGDDSASVVSSAPSRGIGADAVLSSGMGSLNLSGETHYEAAAATERLNEFCDEASASLSRAFAEGHTIENATIELKTLRMASNVPQGEVRRVVTESLLSTCVQESNGGKDARQMASWLDRWMPLLSALLSRSPTEEAEQGRDVVNVMQSFCSSQEHHSTHMGLFVPLLKKFYNDDILSDEALISWWKSPSSRDAKWGQQDSTTSKKDAAAAAVEAAGERRLELRKRAEAVIRWLAEQDDESDSDDDDDDDSE
ncbi:unnamed protein product [Parajaminaea phylloscopi]